jgi:hypothetical protein
MVMEGSLVAGYVIAWAVQKARRAAGRLDTEVDTVIDAGMDKLSETVTAKLGAHPVLLDLDEEAGRAAAGKGEVSELTRQQLELAVTAAARRDDAFGQSVADLVEQLAVNGGARIFVGGDVHADARDGGFAFGQVTGGVYVGDPRRPGR